MFGYIRIRKSDLKICDFCTYRQKYCGLCQMLGKNYGLIYRLILNYDIIFLILALENFEEEMFPITIRCPMNPFRKINASMSVQVAEYSAFINYYMTVLKLEDDIMDEKSFIKKILLKLFNHNSKYKNMRNAYGDHLDILSKLMDNIKLLEKSNANFDELSNSFGEFFAGIFKLFFDFYKKDQVTSYDSLYSLCYNLGKWIYIMDAYDDYKKDIKGGKFNLLKIIMQNDNSPNKVKAHKKIAVLNGLLIFKMKKLFHQITWNKNSEILFNMISLGCMDIYLNIVHNRYPQIESIMQLNYENDSTFPTDILK